MLAPRSRSNPSPAPCYPASHGSRCSTRPEAHVGLYGAVVATYLPLTIFTPSPRRRIHRMKGKVSSCHKVVEAERVINGPPGSDNEFQAPEEKGLTGSGTCWYRPDHLVQRGSPWLKPLCPTPLIHRPDRSRSFPVPGSPPPVWPETAPLPNYCGPSVGGTRNVTVCKGQLDQ